MSPPRDRSATKMASDRDPSTSLRRIRRNLIDNFATILPPGTRVLTLNSEFSFPTSTLFLL
jgi:hypothetical protein